MALGESNDEESQLSVVLEDLVITRSQLDALDEIPFWEQSRARKNVTSATTVGRDDDCTSIDYFATLRPLSWPVRYEKW